MGVAPPTALVADPTTRSNEPSQHSSGAAKAMALGVHLPPTRVDVAAAVKAASVATGMTAKVAAPSRL
jgi:hypothetical protein